MEKIEFTRFIERYLESKMQPAEKHWFEKELNGNIWLRKELDLRRKTDSFVKNSDSMEFRRKLMQAESLHRKTRPIKRVIGSKAAQYAAIFIGLIIISSFIVILSKDQDPSKLAEKYISSYEPGTTSRAFSSDDNFEYKTAMEFYSRADYENAIFWFEKVARLDENENARTDFMLGVSRMNTKQYQEAIIPLENVVDHKDNLFIEQARWYLSICYLNVEDNEKAVLVLEEIASSASMYSKDARKSLRKIK